MQAHLNHHFSPRTERFFLQKKKKKKKDMKPSSKHLLIKKIYILSIK